MVVALASNSTLRVSTFPGALRRTCIDKASSVCPVRVSTKTASCPSTTEAALGATVTTTGSSSTMVPETVAVPPPTMATSGGLLPLPSDGSGSGTGREMVTLKVSLASSVVSPDTDTVKVALVELAGMVAVPLVTAV